MPDSQKLVLMIQPLRLQGTIWQTVLKSQKVSVIWESPDTDLIDNLTQLHAAGLTLPDLLLIDIQIKGFQPYAFCRWCCNHHPGVKVILTNGVQHEISSPERQWAINQGAADLLPGFQREQLVTSVTAGIKRVLEALGDHPLDNGALISLLLAMKREFDHRHSKVPQGLQLNGKTLKKQEAASSNSDAVAQTEGNQAQPSNGNGRKPSISTGQRWRPVPQQPASPSESSSSEGNADEDPPPRRRYRGRVY